MKPSLPERIDAHAKNCECDRDYVTWNTGQFPMRSDEKEEVAGVVDPQCADLRAAIAEELEKARAEAYKRGCTDITKFDVEVAQPEALEVARAEGIAQGRREMAKEALARFVEFWAGQIGSRGSDVTLQPIYPIYSWLASQAREEAKA